jgi:hypothetical protein
MRMLLACRIDATKDEQSNQAARRECKVAMMTLAVPTDLPRFAASAFTAMNQALAFSAVLAALEAKALEALKTHGGPVGQKLTTATSLSMSPLYAGVIAVNVVGGSYTCVMLGMKVGKVRVPVVLVLQLCHAMRDNCAPQFPAPEALLALLLPGTVRTGAQAVRH